MPTHAGCTIVSKNYLPFARVLADSFRHYHPHAPFFVLLTDRIDGYFDPADEPFEILEARDLANLPDFPAYAFKYSILEINTAVKPFFLEHLFATHDIDRLAYFDPDILIMHSLDALFSRLDDAAIALTPHLTAPIDDQLHPGELAILQAGAYNLGFIALAAGDTTDRFLDWWQERVYENCRVDVGRGLFVDQKWIDLVPGMFGDVAILTDPGYNVAYWNLHDRQASADGTRMADGSPLSFFHFSGIDFDDLEAFSKHQNRFTLGRRPELRPLFERYRGLIRERGLEAARAWPYAYDRFDNGVSIPDAARGLYHSLGDRRGQFGDPFATGSDTSFFHWLNEPARTWRGRTPYLSRLLQHVYRSSLELQATFPEVADKDLGDFARQMSISRDDLGLSDVFLEPLGPALTEPRIEGLALRRRLRRVLKSLYHSRLSSRFQKSFERQLGYNPVERMRRRFRSGPALATPEPAGSVPAPPVVQSALTLRDRGLNIAGYIRTDSGMGQGARAVIAAVEARGIPHQLCNLDLGVVSRMADDTHGDFTDEFDYAVNLLFVNADQTEPVYRHLGEERFRGRYNIGFWLWELAEFPREWLGAFEVLDEIWTPSRFCLEAISSTAPIPVRHVPLPVEVPVDVPGATRTDRAAYDLPEDAFVFLFVFDFLSFAERKNPQALVSAFRRAFSPDDPVLLVLKIVNSDRDPEAMQALEESIGDHPVILVDGYYDRLRLAGLISTADAYVSLHRSEGYGLTMAEAMAMGKPVIATGYSANTDFMSAENSFPVRFRMVPIEEDHGPYRRGQAWAEADVDHAAELMRRVVAGEELRRRIGARAAEDIRRQLSAEAVGAVIERRLDRAYELYEGRRRRTLARRDRPELPWLEG